MAKPRQEQPKKFSHATGMNDSKFANKLHVDIPRTSVEIKHTTSGANNAVTLIKALQLGK